MSFEAHPYRYPSEAGGRLHGPAGHTDYQNYRAWLDDEFLFRCAYCLKRQQWAPTDIWAIDHLVPQSEDPSRACDYDNLVLSCQWCNSRKLADQVPDPVESPYGNCLKVDRTTGEVAPLSGDGEILIRILKLNHPKQVQARRDILQNLGIIAKSDPDQWKHLMGFPSELPDLSRKRPPDGNTRPEGIGKSCYERRRRGVLPEILESSRN